MSITQTTITHMITVLRGCMASIRLTVRISGSSTEKFGINKQTQYAKNAEELDCACEFVGRSFAYILNRDESGQMKQREM